jgi:hypothetical protein
VLYICQKHFFMVSPSIRLLLFLPWSPHVNRTFIGGTLVEAMQLFQTVSRQLYKTHWNTPGRFFKGR